MTENDIAPSVYREIVQDVRIWAHSGLVSLWVCKDDMPASRAFILGWIGAKFGPHARAIAADLPLMRLH
jgi:hypothetical protein